MALNDEIGLSVTLSGLLFAALSLLFTAYVQARGRPGGTIWEYAAILHDMAWFVLVLLVLNTVVIALHLFMDTEFDLAINPNSLANFLTNFISIAIIVPSFALVKTMKRSQVS